MIPEPVLRITLGEYIAMQAIFAGCLIMGSIYVIAVFMKGLKKLRDWWHS